jgi:hypothetical protein
MHRKYYQMNATIQKQLDKVSGSIVTLFHAGKDWKADITKFKPMYDKATHAVQVEIRNHVATLIGELYETEPIMLKTGVLGFERTSAESKALRRAFPVDKVSTSKVSKQVDRVAQRAKNLNNDFTKAELRRLVKLLAV